MYTGRDWIKANSLMFNSLIRQIDEARLRSSNDLLQIEVMDKYLRSSWSEIHSLNKKIEDLKNENKLLMGDDKKDVS